MAKKPEDSDMPTIHTYWKNAEEFKCPLCKAKMEHAFNDGGRKVVTIKGEVWVVSNYYRCTRSDCDLNKAFPIVHENVVQNKKYGRDVWERIIRFHFSYHMDYSQILMMLRDEWNIYVSKGTVQNICAYFEKASAAFLDEKVLKEVRENGYIILSLDGAQPKKGHPALWIFSDRFTGHVLFVSLLESATAPVLKEIMVDIRDKYDVEIKCVISDKQKNIVNAVHDLDPDIPHVYCQFHFLDHIMEPIETKDSHLATTLRSAIKRLSIVVNQSKALLKKGSPGFNPLYQIFYPLAEELRCAVSVKKNKWKVFHGKEMYENLQYILNNLNRMDLKGLHPKVLKSFNAVKNQIQKLLKENHELYLEVLELINDTKDLRKTLDNTKNTPEFIKKQVRTWVYRLQSRLKRKSLEYRPEELKNVKATYKTDLPTIWQEWVRLEGSYHEGIYYSYKKEEIEKTNNGKEQHINIVKRHFKKWLGQEDIQRVFEPHAAAYSRLVPLDLNQELIHEILWKHSVAYVEGYTSEFTSYQPITKRVSNIREHDTGNLAAFKSNLLAVKSTKV